VNDAHDIVGHRPGQDCGSSFWARLKHADSEILGAHAHGPADQTDSALGAEADGRRALLGSLGILAVTAAMQLMVVGFTGSVALLTDGLHNVADAFTALPLLIAFAVSRRPPTKRYTYGYGRTEDIAGLFVVIIIAFSAGLAAWQASNRLIHPQEISDLWAVALAAVVGFLGNEIAGRYRIRVGRRIGSAALVADGLHARTDGFTSLTVLLGAAGVALGWKGADATVGLIITVVILGALRSAVRQVGARLLDATDPALVDQATAVVAGVPGVTGVRELRIRWLGHTLRAEVDAVVEPTLNVTRAHDVAHHAERHLLREVPRLTAATIHTSPAGAHRATKTQAAAESSFQLAGCQRERRRLAKDHGVE
jgi:cation diffusion facilitator family transporter